MWRLPLCPMTGGLARARGKKLKQGRMDHGGGTSGAGRGQRAGGGARPGCARTAPLFALWSPEGKEAPFLCIEPWYGRTDAIDFTGELKDREYSNHLDAREVFEKSFSILFY